MFSSIAALAQDVFEKGVIITKDNKRVRGFLLHQDPYAQNFTCVFKESLRSTPQSFQPSEVREFRFESGRRFVSNQFGLDIDTATALFTEMLIGDIVRLYYVSGLYYLVKQDNIPVLLNWQSAPEKKTGGLRRSLPFLLADCDNFKFNVKHISYTHAWLIRLIKKYLHSCYQTEARIYFSEVYKRGKDIGVLGGTFTTRIKQQDIKLYSSPGASLGGNIRLLVPTAKNFITVNGQLELVWQKFNINHVKYNQDQSITTLTEYDFNNLYVTSRVNGGYKLYDRKKSDNKFKVDVTGGFFLAVPLLYQSLVITETFDGNVVETQLDSLARKTSFGPDLGLLLTYRLSRNSLFGVRFFAEFDLNRVSNLSLAQYGLQFIYYLKHLP